MNGGVTQRLRSAVSVSGLRGWPHTWLRHVPALGALSSPQEGQCGRGVVVEEHRSAVLQTVELPPSHGISHDGKHGSAAGLRHRVGMEEYRVGSDELDDEAVALPGTGASSAATLSSTGSAPDRRATVPGLEASTEENTTVSPGLTSMTRRRDANHAAACECPVVLAHQARAEALGAGRQRARRRWRRTPPPVPRRGARRGTGSTVHGWPARLTPPSGRDDRSPSVLSTAEFSMAQQARPDRRGGRVIAGRRRVHLRRP